MNKDKNNSNESNVGQPKQQQQQQQHQQSMEVDPDVTTEKKNDGKILAKDVKSNNFKDYLIQEGFTQFGNLESDYNTPELTFDDIVGMKEADLEKMLLNDYKVKVAQKNRFIKAMKKLPNSKANESNGDTTNDIEIVDDEKEILTRHTLHVYDHTGKYKTVGFSDSSQFTKGGDDILRQVVQGRYPNGRFETFGGNDVYMNTHFRALFKGQPSGFVAEINVLTADTVQQTGFYQTKDENAKKRGRLTWYASRPFRFIFSIPAFIILCIINLQSFFCGSIFICVVHDLVIQWHEPVEWFESVYAAWVAAGIADLIAGMIVVILKCYCTNIGSKLTHKMCGAFVVLFTHGLDSEYDRNDFITPALRKLHKRNKLPLVLVLIALIVNGALQTYNVSVFEKNDYSLCRLISYILSFILLFLSLYRGMLKGGCRAASEYCCPGQNLKIDEMLSDMIQEKQHAAR